MPKQQDHHWIPYFACCACWQGSKLHLPESRWNLCCCHRECNMRNVLYKSFYICILRGSVCNIEWWRAHVVATPTLTNIFRIVPKLNGFLHTRLHWNGSIVSDWENDIKQLSAWKQQKQYLQITAEFIVIDFVENLNKTLMGLDGQLVRLATKMNFHSLLNYHATCTLMLPKSKLIFLDRKQNK